MRWAGLAGWPLSKKALHPESITRVVNRYKGSLIPSSTQLQSVLLLKIIIISLVSTAVICLLALGWNCIFHPANNPKMTGPVSQVIPAISEPLRPTAERSNLASKTSLFAYAGIASVLDKVEDMPDKLIAKATSANPARPDWLINIERTPLTGRFKQPNNSTLISDQGRVSTPRSKVIEEDWLLDIDAGNQQISLAGFLDETTRETPLTDFDQLLPADVADVEVE